MSNDDVYNITHVFNMKNVERFAYFVVITPSWTRQDIINYLGFGRETASKYIKYAKLCGFVKQIGSNRYIHNKYFSVRNFHLKMIFLQKRYFKYMRVINSKYQTIQQIQRKLNISRITMYKELNDLAYYKLIIIDYEHINAVYKISDYGKKIKKYFRMTLL